MRLLFAIVISLNAVFVTASGFYYPAGAGSGGLSHSSVAQTGFWSVINNPSASAFSENAAAGLSYETRFNLKELSVKSLGVNYPVKYGVVTGSFQYFGYEIFNEMRLSLGFSRKFGNRFAASVQFIGLSEQFSPEDGPDYALTLDASLFARFSEKVSLGFYIFNLPSVSIGEGDGTQVPLFYRLGMSWEVMSDLDVSAELRGKNGYEPVLSGGFKYTIFNDFGFTAGVQNNPVSVSAGIVFTKWGFSGGLACNVVRQIGNVWNCSVNYAF